MKSEIKLQVSIDLQGPTFLLPQKKDYPNLLVFDIGKPKVFFFKITYYKSIT